MHTILAVISAVQGDWGLGAIGSGVCMGHAIRVLWKSLSEEVICDPDVNIKKGRSSDRILAKNNPSQRN